MYFHSAPLDDVTSIHSSTTPVMHSVSEPNDLLRAWTRDFLVIPPLWSPLIASTIAQSGSASYASSLHWVYRKLVPSVGAGLCSHLRTLSDSKIKAALRQKLDILLLTVLESEIQALKNAARTYWIASLEWPWRKLLKRQPQPSLTRFYWIQKSLSQRNGLIISQALETLIFLTLKLSWSTSEHERNRCCLRTIIRHGMELDQDKHQKTRWKSSGKSPNGV